MLITLLKETVRLSHGGQYRWTGKGFSQCNGKPGKHTHIPCFSYLKYSPKIF